MLSDQDSLSGHPDLLYELQSDRSHAVLTISKSMSVATTNGFYCYLLLLIINPCSRCALSLKYNHTLELLCMCYTEKESCPHPEHTGSWSRLFSGLGIAKMHHERMSLSERKVRQNVLFISTHPWLNLRGWSRENGIN